MQERHLNLKFDGLTGAQAKAALSALTLTVDGTQVAVSSAFESGQNAVVRWSFSPALARRAEGLPVADRPATRPKPAKPTGVTAKAGNARATLSWAAPDDVSITKYQYRRKAGGRGLGRLDRHPGQRAGQGERDLVHGGRPEERGDLRLRAARGERRGEQPGVGPGDGDSDLPAKPTGFAAKAGNARATLSWDDPSDASITKYQVRRKLNIEVQPWGGWTDIPNSAPGGANEASYTVTSLRNGDPYAFELRAVNAAGNSPASDQATARPVAPAPHPLSRTPSGPRR